MKESFRMGLPTDTSLRYYCTAGSHVVNIESNHLSDVSGETGPLDSITPMSGLGTTKDENHPNPSLPLDGGGRGAVSYKRYILAAEIGGTNSRMEQAGSVEQPRCDAGNPGGQIYQ
jgi:hypothetical protein